MCEALGSRKKSARRHSLQKDSEKQSTQPSVQNADFASPNK